MDLRVLAILFTLWLTQSAFAQKYHNYTKKYVEVGFNDGIYNGSYAGGVHGAIGNYFNTFGKMSAIDLRVKEIFSVSPQREIGAITATYRLFFIKGFYLGAGFAHNHETNFDNYLKDPIPSTIGNGKYIIHRTGFAAETGYDFKSIIKTQKFGLYPVTNICLTYLVLDKEPNPMITASVGFRFGFIKAEF